MNGPLEYRSDIATFTSEDWVQQRNQLRLNTKDATYLLPSKYLHVDVERVNYHYIETM
jgi:hypothetical protein